MRYLFTLLAAAVIAGPAFAQEPGAFGPRSGNWEFTVSGTGANDRNFERGQTGATLELGHYVSRDFSLGLRQTVNWDGGEDVEDRWDAASRAVAQYHFDMGQWRPFLGVNFGYKWGESVEDTFTAGPEGGLKWYVKEETFIYGRAGYDFEFEEAGDAEESFRERGTWVYALGVGFNF